MINMIQYDRLTGLYSKQYFYQQAGEVLLRNPDQQYDIICSDIENFKLINDVFGVKAGDRLLRGIGNAYAERLKGIGICGRLNSDQFACLLKHRDDYTDDMFIEASILTNGLLDIHNIVMKWGIYNVEDRSVSIEQICDRALLAARSIKGQYGKYFAIYDDTLRNQLLREQAITDSMESALSQNQFLVYLQPKYRIKDEVLVGAEALVRWNHPVWGFLSPAEFIPLFEKNGFITRLDRFVWEKACAVLHDWDERGYYPMSVSVNVSRADIYNEDLADTLVKIIEKYDLDPSRLHLEITESAYTENPKQIIDTVTTLRELGFVIEMDDFGSGYSSLNMLNDMPIDILKLDMKFIRSEMAKPKSQGILQFIINLASWMNLSVVAEGVETKAQLLRLTEIGCDYVQGYYFAKPMPCQEFEGLLDEYRGAGIEEPSTDTEIRNELPVLLVADGDEDYRNMVHQAFEGRYRVAGTGDCTDTLAFIAKHKDIAAVILSLTLPGPDGFKVLKTIQKDRNLWNLPIITTSGPDPELEYMALELGADDFIAKPHLMQSLSKRIQKSALFYASAGVALARQGEAPAEAMKRLDPEHQEIKNTNQDKYCLWRKEIL